MTTNEKLIKNFWSNFINKDFDAISEIRNIADRENYTDKELKEINISFVFANILMPIKRRQLPDICYNAKTQKEIFKSGKYDNLLLDIENEATELRKIALHFLPPHIYIKVRDFTNFGKDYKRDLDIYIKENDCTEIDFLKEQIDFCKKQRETLKNIDLYRLFKVRVSKFEKRIKDIQHIQPININESRTKKVIFETFDNIDKQGWKYAFVSEEDFNLFADLLTNFFEYKPYALPEITIQLKRTCKTKVAKALGEIHKELSNENNLSTDTKYFQLIRILNHFEKETKEDLYKALTR
ncbi:MAG: hypothetical protein H6553_00160 [Chitinophagales bacterium]|nr:hypothetical protein [Chitinophagales bacterium]